MQRDHSSSPSSTPQLPSSILFSPTTTTSTPDYDDKSTVSKPYYDLLKDFDFEDQTTEINKDTDIEKIYKIEKISPLIDELATQLSLYKTHEERTKILSESIIFALSSANPVAL